MSEELMEAPAPAEQSPVAEPQETQEAPTNEPEQPRRSRREALEQAFKDVGGEEDQTEPDAQVAEPKEAKPADGAQPRGPDGKFAPKEGAETPKEPAKAEAPTDSPKGHEEPPTRFSADAKTAWKEAPESVRAEAHRAIREMEQGIETYRQRVEPLEPFYKMAEQHNVSLPDVLGRYVNTENTLRQDPVRGFTEIARNMGLSPQQVGQMLLGQQPGQADPRDSEVMQLRQEVQRLSQGYGQVTQTMEQQREQTVTRQIEEFASANPRFEELSDSIAEMLQTGFAKDLQDAYDKADRLNPAPAPQPDMAAPEGMAQTRTPRSVTGAPSPGSNPANRQPSKTRSEALQRAMQRAGF
ncbi:hypothetical protein [Sulfitobacter sp. 1A12157]|uniref:hypothetical protein n=1 Tax=Sulfitobacter sp. 1A12157 TaxID=3368594 RepID=UPI0037476468